MKRPREFAQDYVESLKTVLDRLPGEAIDQVVQVLEEAYRRHSHVFVIGNGGSAATASHMMNDLCKGTVGHKGDAPWARFRVVALTDNVALMTAWANDTDYKQVFSEPLKTLAQRGDVLVAISASGNSPNIIAAVEAAKQMGVKVVGLAGFGGGQLGKMADIAFVVPSNEYGPVEDVHMILDHIITGYLYEKLTEENRQGLQER
ncbi:MAG TPA: SIS domain-containing protein [Verrucomicrobiae bacterium]|nr:SIS domain-containing protein [Verrucomicrobiae bacterium]